MKQHRYLTQATAMLATFLAAGSFVTAQTFNWTGASGADLFWSTPGNWSPSGPPGATDMTLFGDTAATGDVGLVNNVVGAGTTVSAVRYMQAAGVHNTMIDPGMTLTISGTAGIDALLSGLETTDNLFLTNTISGGSLVIDNPGGRVTVRQGAGTTSGSMALLDMSGLDMFTANIATLRVGSGNPPGVPNINRARGWLFLARTNTITASGGFPAIDVAKTASNNSGGSRLALGQTNAIFANSIALARQKDRASFILFNPDFLDPVAFFRAADGVSRLDMVSVGDGGSDSGTTTCQGTIDFTGGMVDMMANTMILGRASTGGTGANVSEGTLTFDRGIIDVNLLQAGLQTTANNKMGSGTVNVNGTATLIVNTALELARTTGGAGAPNTTGRLNINGGTVRVAGDIIEAGDAGTSAVNVNEGVLDMQPAGDLTPGHISADTVSVGEFGTAVISNAATLAASSITIGFGGSIVGATTLDIGDAGTLEASGVSGGLTVEGGIRGAGTVNGDIILATGAMVSPGSDAEGTLTFFSNLTLNDDGDLRFDLADSPFGLNDLITVFGNLTLSGTNNVSLVPINGDFANDTYRLFDYFGSLTGDETHFRTAGPIAQSRRIITFDTSTANQVNITIGGSGGASLTWAGDGAANTWSLNGAANWDNAGSPDTFFNFDAVTFDDTGSDSPAVNLSGTLHPGSVTVNNSSKNYTLSGSGGISGSPALAKQGTASLTIANSGDNSFGAITVDGGTVSIAGGGTTTFDGDVTLNAGTLALDLNSDAQVGNTISGAAGALVKQNANTLTLSGDNSTFDGDITVNAGMLRAGSTTALGSIVGGTVIADGATLDVNDLNLGLEQVTVSGQGVDGLGAIVENTGSGAFTGPNLAYVTLAGHTTFGGTGRWDLRSDPTSTTNAALSTGGNAYDLTKVGANQITLVGVAVDPALADIDVQAGTFAVETVTSSLGNPASTLTVHPGATLQFFNSSVPYDKVFVLNGTGTNTTVNVPSGADNTLTGPVMLNGDVIIAHGGSDDNLTIRGTISGGGSLTKTGGSTLTLNALNNSWSGGLVIGDGIVQVGDGGANGSLPATAITNNGTLAFNSASDLTVANVISGAGTVTKSGEGNITMTGTHSYSGSTIVSDGTLQVDGSLLGGGGAVVSGGTLAGEGTILGTVAVQAGGTVAPGASSIGTLNIVGALTLAGTNVMELNKSGGTLTSDRISGISSLTLGGVLSLEITGDPLAANDEFQLYSATIILPGGFASIEPAEPGPGLTWDTSDLTTSGVLRVAGETPAEPVITSVELSGANLILSGTSGAANSDYHVLTSTNAAEPLANWSALQTNSFDGSGNFSFTNAVDPNTPQRYFLLQVP